MNIFVLDTDPKLAAQALCKLCDKKCSNIKSLAAHLRFNHREWTRKQYYDEFINEQSSLCKCGVEKKFRNLGEGYRDVCSYRCRDTSYLLTINKGRKQSKLTIQKRINSINQFSKEEKRLRTMINRYGVSNPSQMIDFHQKRETTSLFKYGTKFPPQSKKTRSPGGGWKKITCGTREFHVQGYEDIFLEHAHEFGFNVETLIHGKSQCPTFVWQDINERNHVYFPDFYDLITNTVIEIKSKWTYELSIDNVTRKLNSAKNAGYAILCIVYSNRFDTSPLIIT